MAIAALITWLITAAGGFLMLGIWISRGGHKAPRTSKFPPGLIFGHFALAAIGLVLWIVYLVADSDTLSWVAFVVLLPVALLGFTMLARWIPTYRTPKAVAAADTAGTAPGVPAEKHFPVAVVAGHGLFAATTLVLVFLTALG
jgi:manganese efflux pump family protein